jgi:hypothetical protein
MIHLQLMKIPFYEKLSIMSYTSFDSCSYRWYATSPYPHHSVSLLHQHSLVSYLDSLLADRIIDSGLYAMSLNGLNRLTEYLHGSPDSGTKSLLWAKQVQHRSHQTNTSEVNRSDPSHLYSNQLITVSQVSLAWFIPRMEKGNVYYIISLKLKRLTWKRLFGVASLRWCPALCHYSQS